MTSPLWLRVQSLSPFPNSSPRKSTSLAIQPHDIIQSILPLPRSCTSIQGSSVRAPIRSSSVLQASVQPPPPVSSNRILPNLKHPGYSPLNKAQAQPTRGHKSLYQCPDRHRSSSSSCLRFRFKLSVDCRIEPQDLPLPPCLFCRLEAKSIHTTLLPTGFGLSLLAQLVRRRLCPTCVYDTN